MINYIFNKEHIIASKINILNYLYYNEYVERIIIVSFFIFSFIGMIILNCSHIDIFGIILYVIVSIIYTKLFMYILPYLGKYLISRFIGIYMKKWKAEYYGKIKISIKNNCLSIRSPVGTKDIYPIMLKELLETDLYFHIFSEENYALCSIPKNSFNNDREQSNFKKQFEQMIKTNSVDCFLGMFFRDGIVKLQN